MFRASIAHLQESSYAVCCDLVCLETSCCYTKLQHTAQERSWSWTIEVRNMLSYWMLWIKLIIKYCVYCWITYILQNDTRFIQYQRNSLTCNISVYSHLRYSAMNCGGKTVAPYRKLNEHNTGHRLARELAVIQNFRTGKFTGKGNGKRALCTSWWHRKVAEVQLHIVFTHDARRTP